jgi:hypothetical protein
VHSEAFHLSKAPNNPMVFMGTTLKLWTEHTHAFPPAEGKLLWIAVNTTHPHSFPLSSVAHQPWGLTRTFCARTVNFHCQHIQPWESIITSSSTIDTMKKRESMSYRLQFQNFHPITAQIVLVFCTLGLNFDSTVLTVWVTVDWSKSDVSARRRSNTFRFPRRPLVGVAVS